MPSRPTLARLIATLCWALTLTGACSRREPAELPGTRTAEAPQATTEAPPPPDPSFQLPAVERLVAFGDVHGDLNATRAVLRLAGAIDSEDHWAGGHLVVVQTGDQLDRGDDEKSILDLFDRLRVEAKAAGGAFQILNGNHEVMNVAADFRYVTTRGFESWSATPTGGARRSLLERLEPKARGRAAAFLPGGPEAKRLSDRPIVLAIGDTVFAHGGLREDDVRYGLGRLNVEARRWMLGELPAPPRLLESETGPIWSRDFAENLPSAAQCSALERTLNLLRAKRLVVGHSVQQDGINSACGAKVWRIDVGLSKYYGGSPSALEITSDRTRVLTPNPKSAPSSEQPAVRRTPRAQSPQPVHAAP